MTGQATQRRIIIKFVSIGLAAFSFARLAPTDFRPELAVQKVVENPWRRERSWGFELQRRLRQRQGFTTMREQYQV
jgi:hypothetical protein